MADLSYESELIAALMQNKDIFRRVTQSGINTDFFSDNEFNRYIFDCARYLDKIGNPFTQTAFEKLILEDKDLEKREKGVYIARVEDLLSRDVQDLELTLDKLKKVAKQKTLLGTAKAIAHSLQKQQDPDIIHEHLKRALSQIETTKTEFEMVDFFRDFQQRTEARFNAAQGLDERFKFWGNFEAFADYFPRGIGVGTTTSVTGPTFVGKSVVLCNFAYLSVHPNNGMDTIFIAAENMVSQVEDRFDAIFLDRPYGQLFKDDYLREESEQDLGWFESKAEDPEWGRLILVKVPARGFDANTIRLVVEAAVDRGYHPRVLIIDSPDHQKPVDAYDAWHLNKGAVYYENKGITEDFELITFVSTPMKASATKSDLPENEHVAGSIDISRVIDNQLMFNAGPEDKLIGRARLVVTKNRDDGIVDNRNIAFRFKKSMVLIPFDDSFDPTRIVPDGSEDEYAIGAQIRGEDGETKPLPKRTFKTQR